MQQFITNIFDSLSNIESTEKMPSFPLSVFPPSKSSSINDDNDNNDDDDSDSNSNKKMGYGSMRKTRKKQQNSIGDRQSSLVFFT